MRLHRTKTYDQQISGTLHMIEGNESYKHATQNDLLQHFINLCVMSIIIRKFSTFDTSFK